MWCFRASGESLVDELARHPPVKLDSGLEARSGIVKCLRKWRIDGVEAEFGCCRGVGVGRLVNHGCGHVGALVSSELEC